MLQLLENNATKGKTAGYVENVTGNADSGKKKKEVTINENKNIILQR